MNFLTNVYYFLGVIFIIINIIKVYSAKELTKKNKQGFFLLKEYKEKEIDKTMYPNELTDYVNRQNNDVFFLIWVFVGLFTVQWILFLFYLSLNFFIIWPLFKLSKFSVVYTVLYWLNSLIGVFVGVLIIINKYHLKIDFTTLIMEFIKV
jgi:hypothetical protein